MKKLVAVGMVLSIILVSAVMVKADDTVEIEFSSSYLSKYIGENGVVWHNKSVVQTEVSIYSPSGFYVGGWHSTGIDKDVRGNDGAEIDIYLGWSGTIEWIDTHFAKDVEIDVGITYLDIPTLLNTKGDFLQPYVGVKKTFVLNESHEVAPYLRFEFPFPLAEDSPSGSWGVYGYLGVEHSWKLHEKVSLEHAIGVTYDGGAFDQEEGFVGLYKAQLKILLAKRLDINLGLLQVTTPISHMKDRDTEVVYGAGLALRWQF